MGMAAPFGPVAGESKSGALRLDFDPRIKLHFHGANLSSDGGLLLYRELVGALGLTEMASWELRDQRTGRNTQHTLLALFRQSVFGRLAGYEDVNDADRLSRNPVMRSIVSRGAYDRDAASESEMGRFETGILCDKRILAALTGLNGPWIDRVLARRRSPTLILDIDSSESPVHGEKIGHLLKRRPGRLSPSVERHFASFTYRAESWDTGRRVVAKVEWQPGELLPQVGFLITNLNVAAERVFDFYNRRATAEQWIKEGKYAIRWTRLSCQTFAANAVWLQLHALAYNLGNFLRTLALPPEISHWSLTCLRERLIKIGAKCVRHARSISFQLAEVAVPGRLWAAILDAIAGLRPIKQPP